VGEVDREDGGSLRGQVKIFQAVEAATAWPIPTSSP
jgi:hypothetical protein